MRLAALILASWMPALAAAPAGCRLLQRQAKTAEAGACFRQLAAAPDRLSRAEGLWGQGDWEAAGKQFEQALKRDEKSVLARVRYARLLLERFNVTAAEELLEEALKLDAKNPGVLTAMALMAGDSFERRAIDLARKVLEIDPKWVEAQALLARLYAEEGDEAQAIAAAEATFKLEAEQPDALAARAAVENLSGRDAEPWIRRMTASAPRYAAGFALVARVLVIHRRYEEAIAWFRRGLELDPGYAKARSEMGINLMRLGRHEEARRELELAWATRQRDAATANSLKLLDYFENFVTLKTPRTIVRMDRKEAELLRPYVEREAERAIQAYEKKYRMKLAGPVQLELYPNHEDFAVRTLGLPGLGALGVTFGRAVAMDSPSGREPGSYHWASTLWHELSHVFVIEASGHRIPRWFTEGVAVHEETAASPEWGDRVSPAILRAIKDKRLLPVAELDRGFIRPVERDQIMVSYFQAGRIIDYIVERWGWERVLEMIPRFAKLQPAPEVVAAVLGLDAQTFDQQFLAWLERQHAKPLAAFDTLVMRLRALNDAGKAKQWDDVLRDGPAVRDAYPEYVDHFSAYELIAAAHEGKGERNAALEELRRYRAAGGRSTVLLKKLAGWLAAAGADAEAIDTLERINLIYPVRDEDLHRQLGDLYQRQKRWREALIEYRSWVNSAPVDPAAANYHLALALRASGRPDEAREAVLQALESAPTYRPAQRLLLELTANETKK